MRNQNKGADNMLKSSSENLKKNLKFIPVVFLLIMGKTFFETVENGLVSAAEIVLVVVMSLVFSLFLLNCLNEKSFSLTSPQSYFIIATLIVSLGFVISYQLISREILWATIIALILNLICRNIHLLPVAAVISVVVSLYETFPIVSISAMTAVPAAVGVACVYNSDKLKNSEVWKKIIFAGSVAVMIASAIKIFNVNRFNITFHSFKAQIWDSIPSFIVIAIILALFVYSIKAKKGIAQTFGYLAVAAFCIVPTFMDMKFPIVSAMTAFMMLVACSGEGTAADELFGSVFKSLSAKAKSKS